MLRIWSRWKALLCGLGVVATLALVPGTASALLRPLTHEGGTKPTMDRGSRRPVRQRHSGASTLAVAASQGAVIGDSNCTLNELPPNDDGSTGEVTLPFTLNFYGTSYSSLWVNNNGNVTFTGPQWVYTPFEFNASTPPIIAPFFADVDTRGAGSGIVTYGNTSYNGHPAFCVDWPYVGYYGEHTDKLNNFQLLLVNRSDTGYGNFDIVFNYGQIQWETGDASGGLGGFGGTSAGAGFANGDGVMSHFVSLPGSLQNGALLDSASTGLIHHNLNSPTLGRYVFEIQNGGARGLRSSYVALGDSYSSGEGLPPYFEPSNQCHRAEVAFPTMVQIPGSGGDTYYRERHSGLYAWGFLACSGAKTPEVLDSQLSSWRDPTNTNWSPVTPSTSLVTITVGGDDAQFARIMKFCYTHEECWAAPYEGTTFARWVDNQVAGVYNKLIPVYRRIHQLAPQAKILVLGYPQVFPANPDEQDCGKLREQHYYAWSFGYSRNEQNFLRAEGVHLNRVISNAVSAANVGAYFLPVANLFAGHEVCGWAGEWIKGVSAEGSFHPNPLGHVAYASAVNRFLAR